MLPKFANPHLLSQDVEITTRAEIAHRAGFISVVRDDDNHALKRDLDHLLRDTWADVLAEALGPSRTKMYQHTAENPPHEDGELVFRLVSSTKRPQRIRLCPKPSSFPFSRGPDCEDNAIQAETRRERARSVAVEPEKLREAGVSAWQFGCKPVTVKNKVPFARAPLPCHLPHFLVVEEARAGKADRRVRPGKTSESPAASLHEARPSCLVLPVISVPDYREAPNKKRRKPAKERLPPSYWRPSPELRGKCMGYALGYPDV